MVFVSANKDAVRKCRWCDFPAKKYFDKNGRFKCYCKTCGSEACLNEQYKDRWICLSKARSKGIVDFICACCNLSFTPTYPRQRRYCLECCPDKAWRGRANRYGIGKKQWDQMLHQQNGLCKLCDRKPEVVDHCHIKHEVRGLLCNHCNTSLSKFERRIDWLKKALDYLGVEYAI